MQSWQKVPMTYLMVEWRALHFDNIELFHGSVKLNELQLVHETLLLLHCTILWTVSHTQWTDKVDGVTHTVDRHGGRCHTHSGQTRWTVSHTQWTDMVDSVTHTVDGHGGQCHTHSGRTWWMVSHTQWTDMVDSVTHTVDGHGGQCLTQTVEWTQACSSTEHTQLSRLLDTSIIAQSTTRRWSSTLRTWMP